MDGERKAAGGRSIPHLLSERARELGEREILRFEGMSLSFAELDERTTRLANVLADGGIGKGDAVAVMLPNGLDFPTAWLAVAKLGAVVVPLNTSYRATDLAHVLRDSGARLAIAGADEAGLLREVQANCPALRSMAILAGSSGSASELEEAMAAASTERDLDGLDGGTPVTIQYTSGTTGLPKGCVLSHRYWLTLAETVQRYVGIEAADTLLTAQPFCYMDPTWNLVLAMLGAAPLVILPRFSVSTFWRSVVENDVTFFYCLGTMPIYLYKQQPDPELDRGHRVRLVLCSGIPVKLHAAFEERWGCPWRETYGATELGCALMVPADDASSMGTGAMGAAVNGYEARVMAEDGSEAAAGEFGELVVRGTGLMLGYHQQPQATAAWLRDGWAHTGDLVYRDERGYYHIVGRLKEMIRRGGENISAAEVEAALAEHPAVQAAACIPVPDEERGEEVKAFVQLRTGQTRRSLPPSELLEFMRERLAAFKLPRYIEYVNAFPLTPSEKIAKSKLLESRADQRQGAYDAVTGRWN